MGMFENYANTVHPSPQWELLDECTACRNTGWVSYPVHVGVDENELDACPHGCEPMDDNEYRDSQVYESTPLDEEHLSAWMASWVPTTQLVDAEAAAHKDAYLSGNMLARHAGALASQLFSTYHAKAPASVSSDVELHGRVGDAFCTVPAYLVGTPVHLDDTFTWMNVRYEYLGSTVTVEFDPSQVMRMRFAYSWDNNYSTSAMI